MNPPQSTSFSVLFLNDSHRFKKNTHQKITTSTCLLGRDADCTLVFADQDNTVSGRHASIEYDGQHFYLVHLSHSNPTVVNGQEISEVGSRKRLKNNDEIRLSRVGPLFQFKADDNRISRFTQRFQQMATATLKPYKMAIGVLLLALIGVVGVMFIQPFAKPTDNDIEDVKKLDESVYMIRAKRLTLTYSDGSKKQIDLPNTQSWIGTGFLCADGRFVTARHVTEPWLFAHKNDESMAQINRIAAENGKVTVDFVAESSNGFKFNFTNHQFVTSQEVSLQNDWACMQTDRESGNIELDPTLSNQLAQAQDLHLLGFSNGDALQEKGKVKPLYGTTTVAQEGLVNGFINVSNRTFDAGSSGGPVFVKQGGGFVVIGIIVSKVGEIGRILPVSTLKNAK